jgi:Cd2+/Zn2+-exporting ATPase
MAIKKEFILEGLCCGNCATKIEREISQIEGVSSAAVDLMSKTLTMEIANGTIAERLVAQAAVIIRNHDSDVIMSEKDDVRPGRKTLYLLGLGCADCAKKIEDRIKGLKGVESASLDFMSQKLVIEAADKRSLPSVIRQASQIALDIEPGIQISYTPGRPAEGSVDRKSVV